MLPDVGCDGRGQQVAAVFSRCQPAAQLGRRDIFEDGGEQMEVAALGFGELQPGEVVEGKARPADDDPLGQGEEPVRFAPLPEMEKAVGPDQAEESSGGNLLAEVRERIDGVVGPSIRAGRVEGRGAEAGIGLAGKLHHGQPRSEGGGLQAGLQRLKAHGREEHRVELEGVRSRFGDADVPTMRRVEGAAEESYPHAAQAITGTRPHYQIRSTSPVVRILALTDWLVTAL